MSHNVVSTPTERRPKGVWNEQADAHASLGALRELTGRAAEQFRGRGGCGSGLNPRLDLVSPQVRGQTRGTEGLLVGWPVDDLFCVLGVFEQRFCYDSEHGCNEWLLWFEDCWMQDLDLGLPEGSLLQQLSRKIQPDTTQSISTRPCTECVSNRADQLFRVVDERKINGKVQYRIQWKLQWLAESALGDPEWAKKDLEANEAALRRRRSGRRA